MFRLTGAGPSCGLSGMDAALVAAWKDLCQQLAPAFTAPTLVTFLHVASGWVLCRSRPTVTSLVLTVGEGLLGHAAKHWTVYERFFYRSAWSLRELSRLLLVRVVMPLADMGLVSLINHDWKAGMAFCEPRSVMPEAKTAKVHFLA